MQARQMGIVRASIQNYILSVSSVIVNKTYGNLTFIVRENCTVRSTGLVPFVPIIEYLKPLQASMIHHQRLAVLVYYF